MEDKTQRIDTQTWCWESRIQEDEAKLLRQRDRRNVHRSREVRASTIWSYEMSYKCHLALEMHEALQHTLIFVPVCRVREWSILSVTFEWLFDGYKDVMCVCL